MLFALFCGLVLVDGSGVFVDAGVFGAGAEGFGDQSPGFVDAAVFEERPCERVAGKDVFAVFVLEG